MSAIPKTADEACALMTDTIRLEKTAGRSPDEIARHIDNLIESFPEAVRPSPSTINKALAFYAEKPAALPMASVSPVAAEQLKQEGHHSVGNESRTGDDSPTVTSERLMAERLAAGMVRWSLRFLPDKNADGWRQWNGRCWARCGDPIPLTFMAAIHEEVAALLRLGLLDSRGARAMESTNVMRGVLVQLQAHEPMRMDPEACDPPQRVATMNGVLDLYTGAMSAADPQGPCFLRCAAVAYDPNASHPAWDAVAQHVRANAMGAVVQRFLGASLLGIPPDRKLLVLAGAGGDGKSTLLRSCVAALGDFAAVLAAEAIATGGGRGAHGQELSSPLVGARLAVALETGADLDWQMLKGLSGGDQRSTKRMHGRAFDFQPRCWLVLATNTPPRVPDQAAADRVVLVHWSPPDDPDPDIVAVLAQPGPDREAYLRACLRWLVEGCAEYLRDGLGVAMFAPVKVEPEGLAAWWAESVDCGAIRPRAGWSAVGDFAQSAAAWHQQHALEIPSATMLGKFLKTRVNACRRGPRKLSAYHALVGQGRTGFESSSFTCVERTV